MVKTILAAGAAGFTTSALFMGLTATHPLLPDEKNFLYTQAATANYEIKAAELASRMASNDHARQEARLVMAQQQRFIADLQQAAMRRDPQFKLPSTIDAAHQRMLRKLKLAHSDFEEEYGRQMTSTHLLTQVANHEYLSQHHVDRHVKSVVTASMPMVEDHLRSAMAMTGRSLARGQ